jgi:hypothetical protein
MPGSFTPLKPFENKGRCVQVDSRPSQAIRLRAAPSPSAHVSNLHLFHNGPLLRQMALAAMIEQLLTRLDGHFLTYSLQLKAQNTDYF